MPLGGADLDGAGVGGVQDGLGQEARAQVCKADDGEAMVVDKDIVAHAHVSQHARIGLVAFVRPVAGGIKRDAEGRTRGSGVKDRGVGLAQREDVAFDDGGGGAHERRVVDADDRDAAKVARWQAGAEGARVQRHGPRDTRDASHALKGGVGHGHGLVAVFDGGVHDPDVGLGNVGDQGVAALHHAREHREHVGDEEGAEDDAQQHAQPLGGVARQHAQGEADHGEG